MIILRLNGNMPEDPEILRVEISNFLAEHNVAIRQASIEAIREALQQKKSAAEIASISYEETNEDYVLSLPQEKWNEYLTATLESLSDQDEFELCIEIQKLIKAINEVM
jgi:hypothetical protein